MLFDEVKNFEGKNVIISFCNWENSIAKEDYDLAFSYEKTYSDRGQQVNLLFIKNGPALVKVEYFYGDYVIFFDYGRRIFYSRHVEDIKTVSFFNETNNAIIEYLKINSDQPENKPIFNPVFANDPSGVFGSSNANNRRTKLSYFMTKLFVFNLLNRYSNLFDQDFYNKIENILILKDPNFKELNIKLLLELLRNWERDIYELIMERGILVKDYNYINIFSLTKLPPRHCFIATEIYGKESYEVNLLRIWRDEFLQKNKSGRIFMQIYYVLSPKIVKIMRKFYFFKKVIIIIVNQFVIIIKKNYGSHQD